MMAQASVGADFSERRAHAGSCSTVALVGKYLFLIRLLTLLSTYMQSLDNSI